MTKRLYRSTTDRRICGVCGGLGEYFEIDPTIFRIIWLACIFCLGGGILAYFIAALLLPKMEMI